MNVWIKRLLAVLCVSVLAACGGSDDPHPANIVDTAKANEAKLDGVDFTRDGLGMLSEYLDKGDNGLLDPWGQMYQVRYVQTQSAYTSTVNTRIYVYTVHPNTGQEIGWPKEFEPAKQ